MPNWCENVLKVKGENIQDFLNGVSGFEADYFMDERTKEMYARMGEVFDTKKKRLSFTFNSLVPVPKDVLAQGYNNAGHSWQSNHWGTKWDVNENELSLEQSEEELKYAFSTAWSPPVPWVEAASKIYPELTFELSFAELGMMFAGKVVFQDGNVLEEENYSGTEDLKTFLLEEMGYDEEFLDDMFEEEEDEEETM